MPEISDISSSPSKEEKVFSEQETESAIEGSLDTDVQRGLKQRHLSMISMGGTIGTGLFIGIGTPLQDAGPVNALIAYLFIGSLAYSVTQSLGEMATHTPIAGSFCVFNSRYLSRAIGFASNWCYWLSWSVTYAVELFAISQVFLYWTDAVPNWAWMLIFFVLLTASNFVHVTMYGEFQFWVSTFKVIAIVGFIIYALCIVCGAGDQGSIGFRYWKTADYAFGSGILVKNKNTGRFLGFLSSLINAAFTYQGVETTGVSAGESSNPRKAVPKAINKVIFRIFVFYILCLFFLGLCVPYNDPSFQDDESFISTSPFLITIKNAGTPVLPHIFNFVILTTLISAATSNIYIGSRIIYAMSLAGNLPKAFRKTTKQGIPILGVLITSAMGLLCFLNVSNSGQNVFAWLVNITGVAGLVAWTFISAAHLRFMIVLKSRNISRDSLPFKAILMPGFAWYSFFALVIVTFVQGYSCFFDFKASNFLANYISLIIFFVLWLGSQFTIYRKDPWFVPLDSIDLDSDSRATDVQEENHIQESKFEKIWNIIL
ncbi:hypothetical protein CANARDRAFT_28448 [[Candida] arabinofermentans NRRL YB-2248]|uniref:Amino acid permease/ SLC12A domain-containing protein n=1 Tax=[Candida] arabinofermentans NRRL YB-2248 TaxID=983967 RepID=A0A1E4T0C0_9ASCO|nr:hypothetical protein CANARDRAFT_28448 [[Candida] arabinofermentans NRRL YB-2248]